MRQEIVVNDRMQRRYVYDRTEPAGRNFAPGFQPQLSPQQMLRLGVFGGKYMTDCQDEFPSSWFTGAKLCSERHDARLNCFGVNASQSLAVWRRNGWIHPQDPRRWFQWYCPARRGHSDPLRAARSRAPPAAATSRPPLGVRRPNDLIGVISGPSRRVRQCGAGRSSQQEALV